MCIIRDVVGMGSLSVVLPIFLLRHRKSMVGIVSVVCGCEANCRSVRILLWRGLRPVKRIVRLV